MRLSATGIPQILLLEHTDRPEWNLPGGGMESGDMGDPRATAEREAFEETGLNVVVLYQIGKDHILATDVARIFFARVTGGKLRDTSESKQQGWFSLQDLSRINLVSRPGPGYPQGRTWTMIQDALRSFISSSF